MAHEEQLEKHTEVFDLYEDVSEEMEDEKFGAITVMKAFQPQETSFPTIFRTERLVNAEDLEICAEKTELRLQMEHPNIMQMLDYSYTPFDETAAQFAFSGFYEMSETDLMQEIRYRDEMKKTFSDLEIYTIIKELVSGLTYLQDNGMVHGDIRPDYIMMSTALEEAEEIIDPEEGPKFTYKIADRLGMSVSPEQVQIINIREGKSLYLSPFLFNSYMNEAEAIKINPFKADVFAVGMIVLQCGLFMETNDFYDFEKMSFNEELLEEAKMQFKETYADPILVDLIDYLLQVDEEQRMTPKRLMVKLNKILEELEEDVGETQRDDIPQSTRAEGEELEEDGDDSESEDESETDEGSDTESEEREDASEDEERVLTEESKDALERHVEKRIQEVEVPAVEDEDMGGVVIGEIEEENAFNKEGENEEEVFDEVGPVQEKQNEKDAQNESELDAEKISQNDSLQDLETEKPEDEKMGGEQEAVGKETQDFELATELKEDIKHMVEDLVDIAMEDKQQGEAVENTVEQAETSEQADSTKQPETTIQDDEPTLQGEITLQGETTEEADSTKQDETTEQADPLVEQSDNLELDQITMEEQETLQDPAGEVSENKEDTERPETQQASEDIAGVAQLQTETAAGKEKETEQSGQNEKLEVNEEPQETPNPQKTVTREETFEEEEETFENLAAGVVEIKAKAAVQIDNTAHLQNIPNKSQKENEEEEVVLVNEEDLLEDEEEDEIEEEIKGGLNEEQNLDLAEEPTALEEKSENQEIEELEIQPEESENVEELLIEEAQSDSVEEIQIVESENKAETESQEDLEDQGSEAEAEATDKEKLSDKQESQPEIEELEIQSPDKENLEIEANQENLEIQSADKQIQQNQENKETLQEPLEVEEVDQTQDEVQPVKTLTPEKKGLVDSIIGKIEDVTTKISGILEIPDKEEEGQSEYDQYSLQEEEEAEEPEAQVIELEIAKESDPEVVKEIPIQEPSPEQVEEVEISDMEENEDWGPDRQDSLSREEKEEALQNADLVGAESEKEEISESEKISQQIENVLLESEDPKKFLPQESEVQELEIEQLTENAEGELPPIDQNEVIELEVEAHQNLQNQNILEENQNKNIRQENFNDNSNTNNNNILEESENLEGPEEPKQTEDITQAIQKLEGQDSAQTPVAHDIPFTPQIAADIENSAEITETQAHFEQQYRAQNVNPDLDCRKMTDRSLQQKLQAENQRNRESYYDPEELTEIERIKRKYNMSGNYHEEDERLYHHPDVAANEAQEVRQEHEWEQTTKTLVKSNQQMNPAGETQENLEFDLNEEPFTRNLTGDQQVLANTAAPEDPNLAQSYHSNKDLNKAEIRNYGSKYKNEVEEVELAGSQFARAGDVQQEVVTNTQPVPIEQRLREFEAAPIRLQAEYTRETSNTQQMPSEVKSSPTQLGVIGRVGRSGQSPQNQQGDVAYQENEMEEVEDEMSGPWAQRQFNPTDCRSQPVQARNNQTPNNNNNNNNNQNTETKANIRSTLVEKLEDVLHGVKTFMTSGNPETKKSPAPTQTYNTVGGVHLHGQTGAQIVNYQTRYSQPTENSYSMTYKTTNNNNAQKYYTNERPSYDQARTQFQQGSYHSPQIRKKVVATSNYNNNNVTKPQSRVLNPQTEYYTAQSATRTNILSSTPHRLYERKTQERKVSGELGFNTFSKKVAAQTNVIQGDSYAPLRTSHNARNTFATPSRAYPTVSEKKSAVSTHQNTLQYHSHIPSTHRQQDFLDSSQVTHGLQSSIMLGSDANKSYQTHNALRVKQTRATTPHRSIKSSQMMKSSTPFVMIRRPNGKIRVSYQLSNSAVKSKSAKGIDYPNRYTESVTQTRQPVFNTQTLATELKQRSVQTQPRVTRVSISNRAEHGVNVVVDQGVPLMNQLLSKGEGFGERQTQSGQKKITKVIRYSQRNPTVVTRKISEPRASQQKTEVITKTVKQVAVPKSPRKDQIFESIIIPSAKIEKSLTRDKNIKVSITVNNGNAAVYNGFPSNVVVSHGLPKPQISKHSEYKSNQRNLGEVGNTLKSRITKTRRINLSTYQSRGLGTNLSMERNYQTNMVTRRTESRLASGIEQKYASAGAQVRRHIAYSDNKQNRI